MFVRELDQFIPVQMLVYPDDKEEDIIAILLGKKDGPKGGATTPRKRVLQVTWQFLFTHLHSDEGLLSISLSGTRFQYQNSRRHCSSYAIGLDLLPEGRTGIGGNS